MSSSQEDIRTFGFLICNRLTKYHGKIFDERDKKMTEKVGRKKTVNTAEM